MIPNVTHRNRTVRIDTTSLLANALEETHLSADIAAASGTLTVANIDGFSTSQFLWINPYSEKSEIVTTHSSTSPSGSTITLAANTTYAHSAGEKVYRIEFNQVEISHATTLTGSKSVLATQSIQADQKAHLYLDTSQTTGYYFARFKNSVASTFGSYSDGIAYGGWDKNTVGYMIDRVLSNLSLSLSNDLTLYDCYEFLNDGLKLIKGKLKRWPEHYTYNAVLGQISRGTNIVSMPTDAYDLETNKSLTALRLGTKKTMVFLDPNLFDAQLENVAVTQVTTQATSGQTTLEIDNSYDFDDSGSVNVYVSGTKYTITYTGVTRSSSAGILTGVPASGTGSISVTIPVDTYVWQNETEGDPTYYTVRNSQIHFWPLADSTNDNMNLYGDYDKVATSIDGDGDTIDYQRYDMLKAYLQWRVWCKKRNEGKLDETSGFFSDFRTRLNDTIRTLVNPNVYRSMPNINRMQKGSWPRSQEGLYSDD